MEEQESPLAVAPVQLFQALDHSLEKGRVIVALRVVRVAVVGEETEEEVAFLVGQVADLQLLHFGADRFLVAEQHGHHDKRPKLVRDSRNLEIHLGQAAGRKEPCDQVIEKLEDELADRKEQKQGDGQLRLQQTSRTALPGRWQ